MLPDTAIVSASHLETLLKTYIRKGEAFTSLNMRSFTS